MGVWGVLTSFMVFFVSGACFFTLFGLLCLRIEEMRLYQTIAEKKVKRKARKIKRKLDERGGVL
jgi:hypothetical protein